MSSLEETLSTKPETEPERQMKREPLDIWLAHLSGGYWSIPDTVELKEKAIHFREVIE